MQPLPRDLASPAYHPSLIHTILGACVLNAPSPISLCNLFQPPAEEPDLRLDKRPLARVALPPWPGRFHTPLSPEWHGSSPSFDRDSSSFWIWFSKKSIATAKATTASSCNLGGIIILRSPMKPAARDQDIPRGAGIGAPEARETPGGAHRAGRKTRRARQREKHRSDPPSRLPSPPPPGASTNAAGVRFSSADSTAAPPKAGAANTARSGCRALASLYRLSPRAPRPPACLPPSLPSFPPSFGRGRALLRQRCGCGCAAPGPAPYPSPSATTRTHPRTLLSNQRLRPRLPFACTYWTEEPQSLALGSCHGWFPLPKVSTKAAFDWVNLEKEAGRNWRRRGFLGA